MDTQRIIALIIFSFSGLLLWEAWQKHNSPPIAPKAPTAVAASSSAPATPAPAVAPAAASAVPASVAGVPASAVATPATISAPALAPQASTRSISVRTDKLSVDLDGSSGDIRNVVLLKHVARGDTTRQFALMQEKVGHYFIAQSGLLGEGLPNHTSKWVASGDKFDLGGNEKIEVVLTNNDAPGITVNKVFTFKRGSYVIDVRYDIKNDSGVPIAPKAYFQFLRDANPPEGESSGSNPFTGIATFTGPAVYTEQKKFQKVAFSDIDKNKADYVKEASDGWIAMVQHYFVSAWLPQGSGGREYFTKRVTDTLYSAGVIIPVAAVGVIAPAASASLTMPLYVGPQEQEKLKELSPGLDLVVDYGWLKSLAYPMFVVLSFLNSMIGNWGWTIIAFTILLKLVFFPLNQKAGKSMAHMKTLMPKMEALKARYGDDKMKLNQAMMALYKAEKVNPLGGCLPIIIQIPFFIALYWVLLGAVELRNAPWVGWITDLSTPDPYYVLPVLMGASMFIQTKLNPQPADPIQAKVMLILPIVFSIMFFFFPAGLVLYWTMQNILGIAQQWYINKTFNTAPAKTTAGTR
ncbi:MAG: membrane protein insertase YidC [Rhodocyclaceae bacterium]|nr:membrane protein insertase YidC [Rhodocyclaceae bacterium]MCA3025793.1 membrane protein insertase YidC [Rhodocyclaceae bacterium]MCA3032588.1 membrane protein insertase YidC [Rhodocyclaceae bacterium]MCA3036332.1 membrane protein insertase YidC [Rhodocyclaceae bacterium]MCA3045266.1 membrane protein insertase YidC [Rhodocyclaceae bacterium]